MHVEDYGIIGDTETAALVGRNASIDWLCVPRFDSGACFAALLGDKNNGYWQIAPLPDHRPATRRYRPDTLVLETDFELDGGVARVIDCMPIRKDQPQVLREVVCLRGEVRMQMNLVIRFNSGRTVPWISRKGRSVIAKAGPDAVILRSSVPLRVDHSSTTADFTLSHGQSAHFGLHWFPSHQAPPPSSNVRALVEQTAAWWKRWLSRCTYHGHHQHAVKRSLLAIKALNYAPTGGIVASPTTSLPERIGGKRNWDYRFCWLRDASLTLDALIATGFDREARAWRDWLLRAIAGDVADLQPVYGVAGERMLTERVVSHLPGYEGSRPVRIGNAATNQFQLDVYGELINAFHRGSLLSANREFDVSSLHRELLDYVAANWKRKDNGIWEKRREIRPFTHSKAMAWVAVDRSIRMAEALGINADLAKWRALRATIREDVLKHGFNAKKRAFTQYYGSRLLDASVLRLPLVGMISPRDPRMLSTVAAIERELMVDGLVQRYDQRSDRELGAEGAFLPCSFWLCDNYFLSGRKREARELFERLVGKGNDLGLFSEEYDPRTERMIGNFPIAFTQVALINSAITLEGKGDPLLPRRSRR